MIGDMGGGESEGAHGVGGGGADGGERGGVEGVRQREGLEFGEEGFGAARAGEDRPIGRVRGAERGEVGGGVRGGVVGGDLVDVGGGAVDRQDVLEGARLIK